MNSIEINQKLDKIINLLETVVSMNNDLIKANVKLTNTKEVFKNAEVPVFENKTTQQNTAPVLCSVSEGVVFLSGNTFSVKDKIKSLGGKWTPKKKGWTMPCSLSTVKNVIENLNIIQDDGTGNSNQNIMETEEPLEGEVKTLNTFMIDDD